MSEDFTADEIIAMRNGALLGYAIIAVACVGTYVVLKKLTNKTFKKK